MTSDQVLANTESGILKILFDKITTEMERRGEAVGLDFTKLVKRVEDKELFAMWQETMREMERRGKAMDN